MKDVIPPLTTNIKLSGILLLSILAVSSSFYLELVAGYTPCIYCYILRYLSIGILALSGFALVSKNFPNEISAIIAGISMVGVGVSIYLITDETIPSAAICTACSFAPVIMGVSLYYYSAVFMATVATLSITILKSE